jgi:WXG100 family type VII secretion target
MAQAIVDPEELRRFAEELHRFDAELRNRLGTMQARFAALGETWQDQEQAKFAEEFAEANKILRRFLEASGRHAPYLLRKAEKIEEYLGRR